MQPHSPMPVAAGQTVKRLANLVNPMGLSLLCTWSVQGMQLPCKIDSSELRRQHQQRYRLTFYFP
jgi:hypothetical protein